jgi:glycosyltransferase involved in cell wall biosynthesis
MTADRPLRIGLNALGLRPGAGGGGEVYVRSLVEALGRIDPVSAYTVFVTPRTRALFAGLPPNFELATCAVPGGRLEVYHRLLWEWAVLGRQARRRLDVVHFPMNLVPGGFPVPAVLTVHDFSSLFYREQLPGVPVRAGTRVLDWQRLRSCRWATRIAADSAFSADEAVRRTRVPASRVSVVHLAGRPVVVPELAAAREAVARYGVREPYLLSVATVFHHKNLPRLLEAYARARPALGGRKLVLVGRLAARSADLRGQIERLGLAEQVIQTGWVEDEDLPALYRAADFYVFPSLYEGFGLPMLEAAACGVPVVASRAGSLPEIGGDAAVYFDPLSVDDMAATLVRVAGSPELRAQLAERGPLRAAQFSWERTASQMLELFAAAAGRGSGNGRGAGHPRSGEQP